MRHYLDSYRQGDARAGDGATDPVDSNANAGVADVRGENGDITQAQAQSVTSRDRSLLTGPVPLLVFSAVALGSFALVLMRVSTSRQRLGDRDQ